MKKLIYITLLGLILLTSCAERIDFDLNSGENNRLVVEGSITDELKIQTVKLTRSISYFYNEAAPKEFDANVTISDNSNVYTLTDPDRDGIYSTETAVAGTPGKNYTLNIKLKNGELFSAESFMKPVGSMDSLRYDYVEEFGMGGKQIWNYNVYLYAAESPILGDCYLWDMYIDNKIDSDTLREKMFVEDANVNGNYIKEFGLFKLEDKDITKDTTEIEIKMSSISKPEYDHHTSLMMETDYKGSPFDGPPANVPTNITNNGLGFFSANSVTSKKIKIIKGQNPTYWEKK